MFSSRSLWLIFLLQTGAALEYPELYTHAARMGSSTTIPCKFNVDAIPPARRSFTMFWNFQEKEIFRSPNAPKAPDPRLSIDQDRIQDGIADLSMSRVSISDGGLYICSMVQNPEKKEVKEIRLDIHAPPQITITNKTALINKESVLRCAISGFYPVDIDIKWLRNGEMLDNVTVVIPQRGPDGTYSVNSSVTITPTEEDRKRTFSYRIQHESLTAPFQEDFRLAFEDEERTKQNILLIIISVSVAVGVVILIVMITAIILCRKRGDVRDSIKNTNEGFTSNQRPEPQKEPNHSQTTSTRSGVHRKSSDTAIYTPGGRHSDEEAENQDKENQKLISGDKSGDVRETRYSIKNINETSIRNQQPEPREEPNHSQKTATRSVIPPKPPDRTVYNPGGRHSDKGAENQENENHILISGDESGNDRQPQYSINDTNKTSISNQQPEPREQQKYSQATNTRSGVHRKPSDRTVSSPGNDRQPRHSFNNTNKTSISNQQPEPREQQKYSQATNTRSGVNRKPSDRTVSGPGKVWQARDSINDANKRLTSNQQPESWEEPNHSQMTSTRSAVPQKPSDTTVCSPGDDRQPQYSFNNTNKTPIRNQQPEPREERQYSQATNTKSGVHRQPSDTTVATPGNPSWENQRAGHHKTMPEDQKTKPSANNQDAKMFCTTGHVKHLRAMYDK